MQLRACATKVSKQNVSATFRKCILQGLNLHQATKMLISIRSLEVSI